MSESEVRRINEKLTEVLVIVSALNEKLSDYSDVKNTVYENKRRVGLFEQNCKAIQAGKTKINWSMVLTSLASSAILMLITYFVTKQVFGG